MGAGAPMNSHYPLINMQYSYRNQPSSRGMSLDPMGDNPGAGASTIFHNMHARAVTDIIAG